VSIDHEAQEALAKKLNARPEREKFLAYADRAAEGVDLGVRRRTVLGLIVRLVTATPDENMVLRLPGGRPVTAAELLARAYQGPMGAEYWDNWLDYGESSLLPKLLAAHLAAEKLERGDAGKGLPAEYGESIRVSLFLADLKSSEELLEEFANGTFRERVNAISEHREKLHRLPTALREFLNPTKKVTATKVSLDPDVSERALGDFLLGLPKRTRKKEMLEKARQKFRPQPVTDDRFNAVYANLPPEFKRRRGETDRTIALRG
jgi:hypothetical protein